MGSTPRPATLEAPGVHQVGKNSQRLDPVQACAFTHQRVGNRSLPSQTDNHCVDLLVRQADASGRTAQLVDLPPGICIEV